VQAFVHRVDILGGPACLTGIVAHLVLALVGRCLRGFKKAIDASLCLLLSDAMDYMPSGAATRGQTRPTLETRMNRIWHAIVQALKSGVDEGVAGCGPFGLRARIWGVRSPCPPLIRAAAGPFW